MRFPRPRRKRRRILALLPFRDEMRFLPGLFENLAGKVDGVVALDDQSTDESRAFAEAQPLLVDLEVVPPGRLEECADGELHMRLHALAMRHGADWLLGIDADERLEHDFRRRAEVEIDRAEADGHAALWVPWRELWGTPDQMRVDGIWGEKRKACLFTADPDHRFDGRRLHATWAPWPPANGEYPTADLRLYHLRMIDAADRRARVERYERIDPDHEHQEIGYEYLLDEAGMELKPVEPDRGFA
jgi:hypothetical protein